MPTFGFKTKHFYGMALSAPYKDQASVFIRPGESVGPVLPLGTRCSFGLPITICHAAVELFAFLFSLSLTHKHACACARVHTHPHARMHAHTLSLSHLLTRSLSLTHSLLSLSLIANNLILFYKALTSSMMS